MKRLNRLAATIVMSAVAAILVTSGCQEKTASPQGGVGSAGKEPTPEERFQLVFDTFRRGVETGAGGVPGGFIASDDDGHSRLTVNNRVSHELTPPTGENEPYRASITVVSVATYSMARGLGDDEEPETKKSQQRSGSGLSSTPASDSTSVLDPNLISASNGQSDRSDSNSNPVARRDDTTERKFDLVYRNGRWSLTEESQKQLDPKTEQAIIKAFDKALRSQA